MKWEIGFNLNFSSAYRHLFTLKCSASRVNEMGQDAVNNLCLEAAPRDVLIVFCFLSHFLTCSHCIPGLFSLLSNTEDENKEQDLWHLSRLAEWSKKKRELQSLMSEDNPQLLGEGPTLVPANEMCFKWHHFSQFFPTLYDFTSAVASTKIC